MQPRPAVPIDGIITIAASNKSQQRGTHGAFRYFGKLAPDVTGHVLDLAAEQLGFTADISKLRVIDTMCGSGTTLIEACDRGWAAVGIDVNPVACLYASCKTRTVNKDQYLDQLDLVLQNLDASPNEVSAVFGATRDAERWFTSEARRVVAALARNVAALPASREQLLLKGVLLSRLRRISNASARTGRIFYDPSSATNATTDFVDGAKTILDMLPAKDLQAAVVMGDARASGLPAGVTDIVFIHPPYFALYRFSSDVLRFEMEIGGFSRRETAKTEIREGWKSGDPKNLEGHLIDMQAALAEARRLLRPGGVVALTASNSTLGDNDMPVIDGLAQAASDVDLQLVRHFERTAHFGSASYHRSARTDKVIQQDHVLLFRRA